jgi:hypothetical protein
VIHCPLLVFLGVAHRRDGGVATHLVQAAAAGGADAADRDSQLGTDLGVGQLAQWLWSTLEPGTWSAPSYVRVLGDFYTIGRP